MNEPKHTPGPWKITDSIEPEKWYVVGKGGSIWSDLGLTSKANARLIAAAPDLLEFAKIALERLDINNGDQDEEREFIEMAEKAIQKAEDK